MSFPSSFGRVPAWFAFALCFVAFPAVAGLARHAAGSGPTHGAAVRVVSGRAQVEAVLTCPASCNDFDFCTVDSCDTATGTCRHDPLSCDDGNSCTVDRCNGATQRCENTPVADRTACDDRNPCTQNETCSAGACMPGTLLPAGSVCDDGDTCTGSDACVQEFHPGSSSTVRCAGTLLPAGASCNDGNPCTGSDLCDASHHCAGVALSAGTACDDANACTLQDHCIGANGTVRCAGTPADCADGDLCTRDVCDAATGLCSHPPVDCQDGNACTTDVCDPATGQCRRDNVPGPCSDGTACTEQDSCAGGNCVGQAVLCPTFGTCDVAACDPWDGVCKHHDGVCPPGGQCEGSVCLGGQCIHGNVPNGTHCDLNDPSHCSIGECLYGRCEPFQTFPCNDDNPCTDDICGPPNGCNAVPKADGTTCAAGLCSTGTCQAGVCSGLRAVSCDDANPCTVDSCDPAAGCVHVPVGCDDGNPCTGDSCSTTSGACVHAPLSNVPCGSDACNHYFCGNGACTEVEPNLCDDHDACTADRCDPATGCVHEALSCDDGNPCTVDSCDSNRGCVHDGPAQPAKETCNGLDDDCDGLVDERETMPLCAVRPLVMRDGGTLPSFSVTCRWAPACGPAAPPEPIGTVWLSAADLLLDPTDNEALPDPSGHCAEAIVENGTRRMMTDAAVTFVFDPSGNGVCGTSGGGRPGLVEALADVPDGKLARVCVSWRGTDAGNTERCGVVLVRHDAGTEPRPVLEPPAGERLAPPAP